MKHVPVGGAVGMCERLRVHRRDEGGLTADYNIQKDCMGRLGTNRVPASGTVLVRPVASVLCSTASEGMQIFVKVAARWPRSTGIRCRDDSASRERGCRFS